MRLKLSFYFFCFASLFASANFSPEAYGQRRGLKDEEQIRLRGSITPERSWWDLRHYALAIKVNIEKRTIEGSNIIRFKVLEPGRRMQIDLQRPLEITSVKHGDESLKFERKGNAFMIEFAKELPAGATEEIRVEYGGKPVESTNPPWSGGISWKIDQKKNPFIATSCQGDGASLWWPCKDHGYDEPEEGVSISITVPEDLSAVANGRLQKTDHDAEAKTKTFHWVVTQPINNYSINMNIGNYTHFSDSYEGEFGKLDMDFWVLKHQRETALKHFKEAPRTIAAFEHWFGKYPFYEDSYKLVAVPYLGMEHQSSVTYGNGFRNGYRGTDLSETGVGMKFDFIIVHETGHEWFGNNISMKDAADMWIHESFTNYSENLFVEYHFSKKEAEDYVIGCRKRVMNDSPIIGKYDRNQEGSGDMYYKGGNMLHTLRHIVDNDEKWREILRGLNKTFWHQTVTTEQVENFLSEQAGRDLQKFFDQYLRSVDIPVFSYKIEGDTLNYKFSKVVEGFSMPVRVMINGETILLNITDQPQVHKAAAEISKVEVDRNFYVDTENESGKNIKEEKPKTEVKENSAKENSAKERKDK